VLNPVISRCLELNNEHPDLLALFATVCLIFPRFLTYPNFQKELKSIENRRESTAVGFGMLVAHSGAYEWFPTE
jgi:hypothetical protein